MNKEKIVEELNEYMKGLNPKLSVTNDEDLSLIYGDSHQIWFSGFNRDRLIFCVDSNLVTLFAKKGYLTKFYNKAIELMDKYEVKYTVQIIGGNYESFLRFDTKDGQLLLGGKTDAGTVTARFTQEELDALKRRTSLAINWNKAIIERVEG